MGIIDSHVHLFADAASEQRVPDELTPPQRVASETELLAAMQQASVDGAVLVPLSTHSGTCAAALERWPCRFAAVVVPGPDDLGPAAAVRLRDRRADYRFDAVRLAWLADPGAALTSSPIWPLLEAMVARNLVLWAYLPPSQVAHLPQLASLLPGLQIVLNHLGFAPHGMGVDEHRRPRFPGALSATEVARVSRLAEHDNVHLMVSGQYALTTQGPPYEDLRTPIRRLVGIFGAERCLWGSDFPWIATEPGYSETLALARGHVAHLALHEREQIFGGTVRRLFPEAFEQETT